ncbi:hypothetical protein B0H16DRAFT_1454946 [Mycena metata]|uniref:Uncharacterized protein n=1 Tax=Mycena metata TaxID=1033252 RepID=A0AAD7NJF9_9AGAR|nr:hypothetical protein B0H16DRAFT_1454946 [Mycena metata]
MNVPSGQVVPFLNSSLEGVKAGRDVKFKTSMLPIMPRWAAFGWTDLPSAPNLSGNGNARHQYHTMASVRPSSRPSSVDVSKPRPCLFELTSRPQVVGVVFGAVQTILRWVLSSRTPEEQARPATNNSSWTWHEVIRVTSYFADFTCMGWILLLIWFYNSEKYVSQAKARLYLDVGKLVLIVFGFVLALQLHAPPSPTLTAFVSSCSAVGFRSYACAPLGFLLFPPIAEMVDLVYTVRRRRGRAVRTPGRSR